MLSSCTKKIFSVVLHSWVIYLFPRTPCHWNQTFEFILKKKTSKPISFTRTVSSIYYINPLKPSGNYMYHQFNISQILRSAHSVFVCFVWIWEQTAIISLQRTGWWVFEPARSIRSRGRRSSGILLGLCNAENEGIPVLQTTGYLSSRDTASYTEAWEFDPTRYIVFPLKQLLLLHIIYRV